MFGCATQIIADLFLTSPNIKLIFRALDMLLDTIILSNNISLH